MPWLCFGLAIGCFAIAMRTQSIGLALLCLLLALGLMLWGALALVSARIQSRSQSAMALNPALERQRLRKPGADGGGDGGTAVSNKRRDEDDDLADASSDAGGGDGGGD